MAERFPAIYRATSAAEMAGTGPAMTVGVNGGDGRDTPGHDGSEC
jgi:hypothetical protein